MQRNLVLIAISIIILSSCNMNSTEPKKLYEVSGIIYYNNLPIENATVSIDEKLNWSATTNSDGQFQINGVSEGNHTLKTACVLENGSFSERMSEIAVYENLHLDNLKLPRAVLLLPLSGVTSTSVTLTWTRSNASDFREYKVYRHITSGLDETTGELVHVATTMDDTLFVDNNLAPLVTYYYRVFVMNDFGRLGGSNIVSSTTLNKNFIWNGNFENVTDLSVWWNRLFRGKATYCDSVKVEGSYSLMLEADSTDVVWTSGPYYTSLERQPFDDLIIGKWYRFSGWIKTLGEYSEWGDRVNWTDQSLKALVDINAYYVFDGIPANTDWTFIEKTFQATERIGGRLIALVSVSKYAWFDDLRLELLESNE